MLELRRDFPLIHPLAQLKLAKEIDQLVLPVGRLARGGVTGFSLDGQHVVVHPHIEIFLGYPWQVGHQDQAVWGFINIHYWKHVTLLRACTLSASCHLLPARGWYRSLDHESSPPFIQHRV